MKTFRLYKNDVKKITGKKYVGFFFFFNMRNDKVVTHLFKECAQY